MISDTKTELIDLANFMCKLAEIEPIPLRFRDVTSYAGKAFLSRKSRGYIAISNIKCVGCSNNAWREMVVIHEICHFIYWDWYRHHEDAPVRPDHHGRRFRNLESFWLEQFGMVPLYNRTYCHTLMDTDGDVLWSNRGR